ESLPVDSRIRCPRNSNSYHHLPPRLKRLIATPFRPFARPLIYDPASTQERAWEPSCPFPLACSDSHRPACTCLSNVPFLAIVQPAFQPLSEKLSRTQDTFCIQPRPSSPRR